MEVGRIGHLAWCPACVLLVLLIAQKVVDTRKVDKLMTQLSQSIIFLP